MGREIRDHRRSPGGRPLELSISTARTPKPPRFRGAVFSPAVSTSQESFSYVKYTVVDLETLQYRCNICSTLCVTEIASLKRETPSCATCRSSPRIRAVIRILSTELFGRSMPIAEFPRSPEITGVGMSDWGSYAARLEKIFSYTNTFFAKAPKLDITSITPEMEGKYDFVIVSEVLEHVAPPVSRAFANL